MHPPHKTSAKTSIAAAASPLILALALLLSGCGADHGQRPPSRLLWGTRGHPPAAPGPGPAARLATRFARAYARSVYRAHPRRLPGATARLSRRLARAAARVPPARRRLRPRPLGVTLAPTGRAGLRGAVRIGDGHSPPFSVGFTLEKRRSGWRLVSASAPG